jgi:hypothetical protein
VKCNLVKKVGVAEIPNKSRSSERVLIHGSNEKIETGKGYDVSKYTTHIAMSFARRGDIP